MTNSDRADAFRRTRRALDAVNALAQGIHPMAGCDPEGLNRDDADHIVVSLNKAHPAVARALEKSDIAEIQRMVNFTLIHDMGRWKYH